MKRAFKTKQKTFFINFKGLSIKQITQIFLEGENPILNYPGKEVEKHIDLIICNFNKDYLNEEPVTMLFQSLAFTEIVSEPTHIRGGCLDQIYITNNAQM